MKSPQLILNFNSLRHEEVENAMVSVYCGSGQACGGASVDLNTEVLRSTFK